MCALKVYLFFLTSTAFVDTNAEYGISLSRYTVFLQNCPLENCSKAVLFLLFVYFARLVRVSISLIRTTSFGVR